MNSGYERKNARPSVSVMNGRAEVLLQEPGTTKHIIFGPVGTVSSNMPVYCTFQTVTAKDSTSEIVTVNH